MKAKISYTVDLELIPQEVNVLLSEPLKTMRDLAEINIFVENDTIYKSLLQIEEIRKKLIDVDTRLAECHAILVGCNQELARQKLETLTGTENQPETAEEENDSE